MINIVTNEIEEQISKKSPLEFLFINEKGEIYSSYKKDLGQEKELENEKVALNYHIDFLHYFIKLNKLIKNEELNIIKKRQNITEYIKVLLNNNYVIIMNSTHYGLIKHLNTDIIIFNNNNIKQEQIESLKILKDLLNNTNTHTKLCTITNEDYEEEYIKDYNDLIEEIYRKKIENKNDRLHER